MGWRRTVATIRMQLQVFARDLRALMASLDSVSIAILLGAVLVMAGILSSLLALRFGAPLLLVFLVIGMVAGDSGPGQLQLRRRAHHLSGRIGGAGADPVRRRPANPVSEHPRGAGALDGAGHRRRAADGADHRAGRQICARPQLDRGAAGRRGGGVDRCGGGVSAGACAGLAAASARRRDAGSRIRHQRSVRGISDADAGRIDLESATARSGMCCWNSPRKPCSAPSSAWSAAGWWCWRSIAWRCRRACMRRSSPPRRW